MDLEDVHQMLSAEEIGYAISFSDVRVRVGVNNSLV